MWRMTTLTLVVHEVADFNGFVVRADGFVEHFGLSAQLTAQAMASRDSAPLRAETDRCALLTIRNASDEIIARTVRIWPPTIEAAPSYGLDEAIADVAQLPDGELKTRLAAYLDDLQPRSGWDEWGDDDVD